MTNLTPEQQQVVDKAAKDYAKWIDDEGKFYTTVQLLEKFIETNKRLNQ